MQTEHDFDEREVFVAPLAKLFMTGVWLLAAAMPSVLLVAFRVDLDASSGADSSIAVLPLLWLVCAGLLSPLYSWLLGHVTEIPSKPSSRPALEHLPRACARMVHESMAIRANDDAKDALVHAWRLVQDVDTLEPSARETMQRYGASLDGVRWLLAHGERSGRGSLTDAQLSERLDRALAAFEHALCQPRTTGFR